MLPKQNSFFLILPHFHHNFLLLKSFLAHFYHFWVPKTITLNYSFISHIYLSACCDSKLLFSPTTTIVLQGTIVLFLLLTLLGWRCLIKLSRFQVYNNISYLCCSVCSNRTSLFVGEYLDSQESDRGFYSVWLSLFGILIFLLKLLIF